MNKKDNNKNNNRLNQFQEELVDAMFRKNARSFYTTAYAILGNPHDAEDAVQDTAILALLNIRNLKNTDFLKTWVTRILKLRTLKMCSEP